MIIGLDVGGTHTDIVLLGNDGVERQAKVQTNSSDLLKSVWSGIQEIMGGIEPAKISRVVLSTTLTTNSIVENKLVEAGVIVSAGPGIAPESFQIGNHYYCVSGSIDHRGREIQPISRLEVEAITSRLKRDGVRNLAVVGKFSVRNPQHELSIREALGDDFEHVVLGHKLSGNLSFPRRIATAFLNAAVYPIHARFFDAVKESLARIGLNVPIQILKADGGTMSMDASLESPGQTILSGPAASVMGSLPFASESEETLVLDIGGTTTDMAILIRKIPLLDPVGCELGGYKTLIRSLKTRSVGLGGDSAIRVRDGRLLIGPDRHGPAMAQGGSIPTPTDALVVLGKVALGDRSASLKGINRIAEEIGATPEQTADRILDEMCHKILVAASQMIEDINSKPVYTVKEVLEDYKIRLSEVLVLGGPARYFADLLAEITDFRVRVVPRWQVANAIGAALARNTSEVTLFADTERGVAVAPKEGFTVRVRRDFDRVDALKMASDLLRKKHPVETAGEEELEIEVLENLQFNMIRNSYNTGRNIRVKVQVKPGLIAGYQEVAGKG